LRPTPPLLVRLVVSLALVWAAVALAREAGAAVAGWDDRRLNALPCNWRFGMAPVERLERSLAEVRDWLPRDGVVLFASPPGSCGAQFYRWRWAAYLMPNLQVRTPDWFADRRQTAYELAWDIRPAPPPGCRLDSLRDLDGGSGQIYRVFCP
jgi:hypothetical protein